MWRTGWEPTTGASHSRTSAREHPSQFIDVRGEFIDSAKATLRPDAQLVWVTDLDFLREQKMTYAIPWMFPAPQPARSNS